MRATCPDFLSKTTLLKGSSATHCTHLLWGDTQARPSSALQAPSRLPEALPQPVLMTREALLGGLLGSLSVAKTSPRAV